MLVHAGKLVNMGLQISLAVSSKEPGRLEHKVFPTIPTGKRAQLNYPQEAVDNWAVGADQDYLMALNNPSDLRKCHFRQG
jgi:hypothetical protein